MHQVSWNLVALAALLVGLSGAAHAAPQPAPWSFGVLGGEALNHNVLEILPKAVQGKLEFKPAHLAGVMVRRELDTPEGFATWGRAHGMLTRTSLEVDLLKGGGLVDNTEVVVAWRPAVTPWPEQPVQVEFAWGMGVSQSLGTPWSDFVDPDHPNGYRTLFHMSPEIALRWRDAPDWSLTLRIHHRSGLYGVFGPRRVGSNHLMLALVRDF
jgi:hypothetical protein